jgi:iron complex outermembrane receptor protein
MAQHTAFFANMIRFFHPTLFILLLLWTADAHGQITRVTIQSDRGEALIGATVLVKAPGQGDGQFAITDEQGRVSFDGLAEEVQWFQISYIGFSPLDTLVVIDRRQPSLTFTLREAALDLAEVTVRARRPLVRQEEDKMIVDPEPLAHTSTNSLEILEQTPGIFVDQDGYIYLNSATPAKVFINGREQKLSREDMAAVLRSIPPENIRQIEILRTPSTRYDAASSGGIVNVVLRKGVRIGRTGSVRAGADQGFYGNQFAGFNLNDSDDRNTWYLSFNYNRSNALEELSSKRFFPGDTTLWQDALTSQPGQRAYLGFGVAHALRSHWELSFDGRISRSQRQPSTDNTNQFRDALDQRWGTTRNLVINQAGFLSAQNEIGLLYKLDSLDREWDTRFSFDYSRQKNDQDYRFPDQPVGFVGGQGDNVQQRRFFLFQSDLTWRLSPRMKVETGVKSTWQTLSSDADYVFRINGNSVPDPIRTNAFDFVENLNAAYIQGAYTLPAGLVVKSGVRAEHTYMHGKQTIPADTAFRINRVDLFPYVYLSRKVMTIADYDLRAFLIYRRTIARPDYQNLNPYIRYVDPFFYETGNPSLQPQFTNNYEANVSFDDFPVFAVGQNVTRDIFSNVVYQDPIQSDVLARTWDNVGQNRETYFRIVGAIPPGGVYFFALGAQYNLNEYEGLYEGVPLSFTRGSWRFFTFHMLKFTERTRLTLSGFMMLNGQMNFYELDTFGQLNAGLSHTMLGKKLQVSLYARDLLRTMVTRFRLEQGGVITQGQRYSDNQRFGVQARYSFGIKAKEDRRDTMKFEVED